MLRVVNEWIDQARVLLSKQTQIPLIDDTEIEMDNELWLIRDLGDDEALRAAIENVLSRDLGDLAARFVALNAYYRLMSYEEPQAISYSAGGEPLTHENIRKYLGYLVGLREPEDCTSAACIRWEIVNASAVKDYRRMIALSDQLTGVVPDGERYYLLGRLHFLMAILHTLDTEDSLEHWDLPLGPQPEGLRKTWQWTNAAMLLAGCVGKVPAGGVLTDDGQDQFRDATKFLEKALKADGSPPATARLMLARAYACLGDGANAAKQYEWMLDHEDVFFQACKTECPLLGGDATASGLSPREAIRALTYACLIDAYDLAGELAKAIEAAGKWSEACPNWPGVFEGMARLQQKVPDPIEAAEYIGKENERREALGDNAFGEDPNVSIILALGGVVSPSWWEEMLKGLAASHPHERGIVERVLRNYWPAFSYMSLDDQQQWITGSWLLATNEPGAPRIAVHCSTLILEGALRNRVFARFREHARSNGAVLAGHPDPRFDLFLKGKGGPTLGEMFTIFFKSRRPESPASSSFTEWLRLSNPLLLTRLAGLRKIVDFRNAVCHSSTRIISTHEAEEVCQDCRSVIDILYSR